MSRAPAAQELSPELLRELRVLVRGEGAGSPRPDLLQTVRQNGAFSGRRVLVTGAGGSIGSAVAHLLSHLGPQCLVLLDKDESGLVNLERRLPTAGGEVRLELADLRFPARVDRVLRRHRPDIIIHAAAHKHVVLLQTQAAEAVSGNVLATRNLIDGAAKNGVQQVTILSTDKAVDPSSVMGASKCVAEWVVLQAARELPRPRIAILRCGNVLGSRGSVVPLFLSQIAAGKQVTVRHTEATRYFLSIEKVAAAVLQLSTLNVPSGCIAVPQMGKPISVMQLAEVVVALSDRPETEIIVTRLHAGEKLHESLFTAAERRRMRERGEFLVIEPDSQKGAEAPAPPAKRHGRFYSTRFGVRPKLTGGGRALLAASGAGPKRQPRTFATASACDFELESSSTRPWLVWLELLLQASHDGDDERCHALLAERFPGLVR